MDNLPEFSEKSKGREFNRGLWLNLLDLFLICSIAPQASLPPLLC
jgi:hypothetical protein